MRRSRTFSSSSSSATLRLRFFTAQGAGQYRRSAREMGITVWENCDNLTTASAPILGVVGLVDGLFRSFSGHVSTSHRPDRRPGHDTLRSFFGFSPPITPHAPPS